MDAERKPDIGRPDIDESARESGAMEVLQVPECWTLLASVEVGRLALYAAGEVDIFPVNFVVDGDSVVFRTAEGTKLLKTVMAGRVAFEVDGYEPEHGRAWSVVCKGDALLLDHWDDVYAAETLPLFPWNHSPKGRFVRVRPTTLSGRRFTVYQRRADVQAGSSDA
jgi:uncharacterized protein